MGQSGNRPARHFVAAVVALTMLFTSMGCDRRGPGTSAKHPSVASLSPAATDIVVAIGAVDHLVAVSNYDFGKAAVSGLPGAGDYLTVDWERLAELRPDVLLVQVREAAAPDGFKDRAKQLNIRPVFIHIDDLDDIAVATKTVGDAIAESEKAAAATRAMRDKLAAVAQSVSGKPRVSTLIVTDEVGAGVAGAGTFLDELLTIAGGTNAAAGEGGGYPKVDREKIIALAPAVVLHLLPDKPAPTVEQARKYWERMPDVPAVKNARVHVLTQSSVMHPGLGVGEVAELFAEKIHPDRHTAATTRSAKARATP
jgi:iron complex transport system substrate-binding protein